jgi:hypothetical protein
MELLRLLLFTFCFAAVLPGQLAAADLRTWTFIANGQVGGISFRKGGEIRAELIKWERMNGTNFVWLRLATGGKGAVPEAVLCAYDLAYLTESLTNAQPAVAKAGETPSNSDVQWVENPNVRIVQGQPYNLSQNPKQFRSISGFVEEVQGKRIILRTRQTTSRPMTVEERREEDRRTAPNESQRIGAYRSPEAGPRYAVQSSTVVRVIVTNAPPCQVGELIRIKAMPIGRGNANGEGSGREIFDCGSPELTRIVTSSQKAQ